MPQEQSNLKEKSRINIREPQKYNVVFHNDDFTPMEFVVFLLTDIFHLNFDLAERLMLKVHNEGKAVVGSYSLDIAQSKAARSIALARNENFPLKITVEPA